LAVNKRKVLENARKFAQKGAKEKALKEYAKLVKLDPGDSRLRLEIGDAHRRWGQTEEAVAAYSKVAEQFMKEGFDARAVAVYKQIQNLDAEAFSSYEPLSELYQRMGLTAEAISCLETAADIYHKAGQKEEALGLLRKMSAIDPTNTTSRIRVADLLPNEGLSEDAITEYQAACKELRLQNDEEGVAKVYERILKIDPDRLVTLVEYAKRLIEQGGFERAEALLVHALELDRTPEKTIGV
jgi:tetratricopeptide (TPR) repeat protein